MLQFHFSFHRCFLLIPTFPFNHAYAQRLDDSGDTVSAWIYHRPDCSKKYPISSGDWVAWETKRGMEEVAAYVEDGFPVYRGQHSGEAYEGDISLMIDSMLADIHALDSQDPDRQV